MNLGGIYRATVVDNDDTHYNDDRNVGRIKIKAPQIYGDLNEDEMPWAWPCFLLAGIEKVGEIRLPRKESQVWIMFDSCDIHHPVWIGGCHGKEEVPDEAKEDDNDHKYPDIFLVKPFAGDSYIRISTSESEEDSRIEIKCGDSLLYMDTINKEIGITTTDWNVKIVSDSGNLTLTGNDVKLSGSTLNMEFTGDSSITCGQETEVTDENGIVNSEWSGTFTLTGQGEMKLISEGAVQCSAPSTSGFEKH